MRNINVLSGLICVGKSTYLKKLTGRPEFGDAFSISLDEVGLRYWGRRVMTRTEKVYRNQLAREEIQRRIIVDCVSCVLLEMVMLTHANHQEPFVRMITETERYLRIIEPERAALGGRMLSENYGVVRLNVVLLYCSLERVRDRIERRNREGNSNSPALTLEGVFDTAVQFEMPDAYHPLPINTTDESDDAEQQRMREMTDFLLRGERPPQEVIDERMAEANTFLQELQQEAGRVGIVSGAAFLRSDYQLR